MSISNWTVERHGFNHSLIIFLFTDYHVKIYQFIKLLIAGSNLKASLAHLDFENSVKVLGLHVKIKIRLLKSVHWLIPLLLNTLPKRIY